MNNNFFYNLSLKLKITIAISGLIFLISIFITIYFPSSEKRLSISLMENKATSISHILAENIKSGLEFSDKEAIKQSIELVKKEKDLVYIIVYDAKKSKFIEYNAQNKTFDIEITKEEHLEKKADLLVYESEILSSTQQTMGAIEVGFSLKEINSNSIKNQLIIFSISIFILLLGIVTSYILVSLLVVNPVTFVYEILDDIAEGEGNLTSRLDVQSNDEIGKETGVVGSASTELDLLDP